MIVIKTFILLGHLFAKSIFHGVLKQTKMIYMYTQTDL